MVIPPHSSKELIDEGTALRHCVGRYVKRVAQRECVILFVRKVAEPDKSLCTVEVRDGQVVQTRGFDNEDPPAKSRLLLNDGNDRCCVPQIRPQLKKELDSMKQLGNLAIVCANAQMYPCKFRRAGSSCVVTPFPRSHGLHRGMTITLFLP